MLSLAARQLQRIYPRLLAPSGCHVSESTPSTPIAEARPTVSPIATRRFSLRHLNLASQPVAPFVYSPYFNNSNASVFARAGRRWLATDDSQKDETLEAEHHDVAPKEIEPEVTTSKTHEFQAETPKLLHIFSPSLYS